MPTAHPRVCGENPPGRGRGCRGRGSSPRVRGKLLEGRGDLGRHGLIPACAGKTGRGRRCRGCPGAHPRVCGENSAADSFVRLTTGSSPRVRGKLREEGLGADDRGLIPTCAGKTPGCGGAVVEGWAHPRVCGENAGVWGRRCGGLGSSPRVRGKQHVIPSLVAAGRLIPACAGKTVVPFLGLVSSAAHPRVCGENQHPRVKGD